MSALPTNYVDAVLDATANTRRKYNLIENGDGTVSLEEVTTYTRVGSNFGASDINNTNSKVNTLESGLNTANENITNLGNNLADYSINTPLRNVTYYNGKLYQINSNGTRGSEIIVGGVKSVQRGVNTFSSDNGNISGSIPISAVNTAKSMVIISCYYYANNSTLAMNGGCGGNLASSTSIRIHATVPIGGGANATVCVEWQVIEFY